MPHLRFRSLSSEIVGQASLQLPSLLAQTMQTNIDNFTFEKIESFFFNNGVATPSYPFVEVWWFKRSQEVQNLAAQQITEILKNLTQAPDIIVTFYEIPKENYYENGQHF